MKIPSSLSVGRAIRTLRERGGQSHAALSRASGVSGADLASIEAGRARPSIEVLHRIANALGSTLIELVHDAGTPSASGPHGSGPPSRSSAPPGALGLPEIARAIVDLPGHLGSKVDAAEASTVLHAMTVSNHNQSAAARLLGMERKAFVRRLARARRRSKR